MVKKGVVSTITIILFIFFTIFLMIFSWPGMVYMGHHNILALADYVFISWFLLISFLFVISFFLEDTDQEVAK